MRSKSVGQTTTSPTETISLIYEMAIGQEAAHI
jgi:hypothetical protein